MFRYRSEPSTVIVNVRGFVPTAMVPALTVFVDRLTVFRVEYPYCPTYKVESSIDVVMAIGLVKPLIVFVTVFVDALITLTVPEL